MNMEQMGMVVPQENKILENLSNELIQKLIDGAELEKKINLARVSDEDLIVQKLSFRVDTVPVAHCEIRAEGNKNNIIDHIKQEVVMELQKYRINSSNTIKSGRSWLYVMDHADNDKPIDERGLKVRSQIDF